MIRAWLARRRAAKIEHQVCCDHNRALCGVDVTDSPWVPNVRSRHDCPACLKLSDRRCDRVGCDWVAP